MPKAIIEKPAAPETLTKVLQVRTKAVEPTDEQVELIRPYLLREFGPDDLYIRMMELANDQTDRSFERFDKGYLQRFAETIDGKSVLFGHEYGSAPVGRFFDANVGKGSNGWQWVKTWFYMPKSAGNELARDNIDSGVWSYVSIGAYVDWAGLTCDICGRCYYPWYDAEDAIEYCWHIAGKSYEGVLCTTTFDTSRSDMSKVEAVEGSIVYLGCQYDAAIAKTAGESEKRLEYKATLLGPDARAELRGDKPEAEPPATETEAKNMDELEKLKAEHEATKARVAELETTVADQGGDLVTLREDVVVEIKRLAACCKEEAVLETLLRGDESVETLLKLRKDYQDKWAEKAQASGKVEPAGDDAEKQPVTNPADASGYALV